MSQSFLPIQPSANRYNPRQKQNFLLKTNLLEWYIKIYEVDTVLRITAAPIFTVTSQKHFQLRIPWEKIIRTLRRFPNQLTLSLVTRYCLLVGWKPFWGFQYLACFQLLYLFYTCWSSIIELNIVEGCLTSLLQLSTRSMTGFSLTEVHLASS